MVARTNGWMAANRVALPINPQRVIQRTAAPAALPSTSATAMPKAPCGPTSHNAAPSVTTSCTTSPPNVAAGRSRADNPVLAISPMASVKVASASMAINGPVSEYSPP